MNGVASQHSQSQSLLNSSTVSGPAGIADHISGAGSTSTSNQQALQHSPHHDSTSSNDTNLTSDSSDLEPLTTTVGVTEALLPKEQPPGDKVGEGQEPVVIKEEGELLHGTVNGQIELLEHTSGRSVGSGDAEVMVNDSDAQDWIPDADHELKRVKVCQPSCSRHLSSYYDNAMFSVFNGKIISFSSNYLLLIIRCTNLSAHGGWIKGQPFALASFKKKQMKLSLSPVRKGIITTSYFQLLFAQTMFISGNKVSSIVCNLPAHAHMIIRRSSSACYCGSNI